MSEQNVQDTLPEYPVFKGLQKPLEFMGLQGRYIYWAAATAGCGLVGFIIAYLAIGFLAGLVTLTITLGTGTGLILVKQQRGLHSKKIDKGVFVYAYSRKL